MNTGYDEAYDAAMATVSEATEPVAEIVPAVDDGESFYDAYDDLYDFESAGLESAKSEAASVVVESNEQVQVLDSTPAWLAELVTQMLAPAWTASEITASETLTLVPYPPARTYLYIDECAQAWDCESDDWAQSVSEEPSLVLEAADTLDGIASILREAAEVLRGLASRNVATARAVEGNPSR